MPLFKRDPCASDRALILLGRGGPHGGQQFAVDRRSAFEQFAAAQPLAAKYPGVVTFQAKFAQNEMGRVYRRGPIVRLWKMSGLNHSVLLLAVLRAIGNLQFAVPASIRRHSLSIIRSASSMTASVTSKTGRRRIERSPQRTTSKPSSNAPFQKESRRAVSGRSKASIKPRPRTAVRTGCRR